MTDKDKYLKDLFEDLKYSVSKFDTQALTIGGGALGISLTFIKEIVPFDQSLYIILFYFALVLFIISIALGFIGHYISIKQISKSLELVSKDKYSDLKSDKWIPRINFIVATTITTGILMLVIYCIINIEHQRRIDTKSELNKSLEINREEQNGVRILIEGDFKNFHYKDTTKSE